MIKLVYVVHETYISFEFSGDKKEIQKIARELTKSSILSSYSYSPVSFDDVTTSSKASFSINLRQESKTSITSLLWYLRTQLDIEILPERIKQAAQHFEDSLYNKKLWADILEEVATNAIEDIPSVLSALTKYRKEFDQELSKVISKKTNPQAENKPLPSSTTNYWKIGFFAVSVASATAAITTLALTRNG